MVEIDYFCSHLSYWRVWKKKMFLQLLHTFGTISRDFKEFSFENNFHKSCWVIGSQTSSSGHDLFIEFE